MASYRGFLHIVTYAMKSLPRPKSFKRLGPPLWGILHFVDTKALPKDAPKVVTVAHLSFVVFFRLYALIHSSA
jgi:hypothetical protein